MDDIQSTGVLFTAYGREVRLSHVLGVATAKQSMDWESWPLGDRCLDSQRLIHVANLVDSSRTC